MTPEEIEQRIEEIEEQLEEILSTIESWKEEKTKVAELSPDRASLAYLAVLSLPAISSSLKIKRINCTEKDEGSTEVAELSSDKILTAIKDSMHKWWSIIMCAKKDEGPLDCALCHLFAKDGCKGCPISEKTKKGSCNGTPYQDWCTHHNEAHPGVEAKILCPECASIAADMYKFLDELRKDYETS